MGEVQLDAVVLRDDLTILDIVRLRDGRYQGLAELLTAAKSAAVAIDSPSRWALEGKSRRAERDLAALGIQSYRTPARDPENSTFYNWMRSGFLAYEAARAVGYPLSVVGQGPRSFEIFPYASAVALRGCLRPRTVPDRIWRRAALQANGVPTGQLTNNDHLDAALAALTALRAVVGPYVAIGDPLEGQIVLPTDHMPERYVVCESE